MSQIYDYIVIDKLLLGPMVQHYALQLALDLKIQPIWDCNHTIIGVC